MTTKTDEAEALAKERLILKLFKLYRYLDGKADRALTEQYLEPVHQFSLDAVKFAYERYRDGQVDEDSKTWLTSVPNWIGQVRFCQRITAPRSTGPRLVAPEGYKLTHDGRHLIVPAGKPVPEGWRAYVEGSAINYGHGLIQLGGLTHEEGRIIDQWKGITPDGKNMAHMQKDELRAAIKQEAIAGPSKTPTPIEAPSPKMKRI